jgi:hypothetical protein
VAPPVRRGQVQVKVDTSDLDPQIEKVRDTARMGLVALMLVGLLIASAIAETVGSAGALEPLRQAALVTYAAAAAVTAIAVLVMGWRLIHRR